jgi:hypothetical protein
LQQKRSAIADWNRTGGRLLCPGASFRGEHLAVRWSICVTLGDLSGQLGRAGISFPLYPFQAGKSDLLLLVAQAARARRGKALA